MGKYLMLAICGVSAMLAGLSVMQAYRDGVFALFVKVPEESLDIEKARRKRMRGNGNLRNLKMVNKEKKTPFKILGRKNNFWQWA